MIKVIEGQDPYSVIGKYIRSHINAIEDIIAVIEIDGVETNQLFMVNMNEDGYFIWKSDWYEGEKDIVLIDFFPVSEAKKSSAEPGRGIGHWIFDGEGMLHCSACAEIPVNRIRDTFKVVYDIHPLKMNYCPNCGVRMVGEQ